MKILATSDLHGNLEGLSFEGIDIVVIAGDFACMAENSKWDAFGQKKWIEKKLIPLICSYSKTQFVLVPGNHDFCLDPKVQARYRMDWRISWPSNSHVLLDSSCEINGLKIYGTPYVPIISYYWAFEAEHDELQRIYEKIPSGLDILVTHSPPRISGEALDISLQNGADSEAFGSSELTQALFDKQPRFCFCGHIHSGFHGPVKFEGTMIYNVSRVDERYEIAYEPTFVEL